MSYVDILYYFKLCPHFLFILNILQTLFYRLLNILLIYIRSFFECLVFLYFICLLFLKYFFLLVSLSFSIISHSLPLSLFLFLFLFFHHRKLYVLSFLLCSSISFYSEKRKESLNKRKMVSWNCG